MKFLADENVEQPIIDSSRSIGHDVAAVGEIAPGGRDEQVLQRANAESRILLTNDRDFGELVYRESRLSAGILLLRFQAADGREKAARLADILPQIEKRLPGHFAVVTEERARLRPLRVRPG
jgi:predicted nuclease of predicted toxin-antitoxin system